MEQWNNNFEFRKDYIRCNMRSTLWRLKTLDGRSLGPDEDPPVIPHVVNERLSNAVPPISTKRVEEQVTPVDATKAEDKCTTKVADLKNKIAKTKKPTKHAPSVSVSTRVFLKDEIKDVREEEQKRAREEEGEEEESARQAEQLRKEEQAAKLKEQRRLEEKTKAAEALERKKRIAERAQARAVLRAQREAEQKEKEREKRAIKKEKRKAAAGKDADDDNEGESNPSSENITQTPREHEIEEMLVPVKKRPQKAPQFKLQSKAKSIPPPLRNRGKKRMQTWTWVLLAALGILALFLLGNIGISFHFGLRRFGL